MIKNFKPRLYQETIFNSCTTNNTLIVLPTGLGKTNIFLMIAAFRLKQYPNSKILLIGPTKPLIDQYYYVFQKHFDIKEEDMNIFTGMIKPEKRAELWKKSKIIFSTPQGLENDIITKRIDLKEVSLLGVDEAHRAVGDYSYVFIVKEYEKKARFPRIIGMTASPGSNTEKIMEVCKNLFVEKVEIKTEKDGDVKPYIKEINVEWIQVELPHLFYKIISILKNCSKQRAKDLKSHGIVNQSLISKKDILITLGKLQGQIAKGNKSFELLKSISLLAEIIKVEHALELLETQGVKPLFFYMQNMIESSKHTKVKAVKNLVNDEEFKTAFEETEKLYSEGKKHSKLIKLVEIIKQNKNKKTIIFSQFRESATEITEELINNKFKAKTFVGQAKRRNSGLTQKKQKEMMDSFRNNEFNILVATSVAEEGLDIPLVDLVIFYEPIPSAIRTIQRRGRTGRQDKGKVIILMTKNTREEGYRWSSFHKEKRMNRILNNLKNKVQLFVKKDNNLNKYIKKEEQKEEIKVIIDFREKGSKLVKELINLGADIDLKSMNQGDFLLSKRVCVELKTQEDFVNSILDGRLLTQIKELKKNFEKPLLVIQGNQDIYSIRRIHPNAIKGMIATIAISYGIPLISTKDHIETASLFYVIAKREQIDKNREFYMHTDKKTMSLNEQQEYIISAFPGVGTVLARPLLEKFESIKNVINAPINKLMEIEKIGEIKAKRIKEIIEKKYKKN